jgi:hypothetical protein
LGAKMMNGKTLGGGLRRSDGMAQVIDHGL